MTSYLIFLEVLDGCFRCERAGIKKALDNFVSQKRTNNYNYGIPYDVGSIMHYGSKAFSSNKKPTMVPKDVLYTKTLGSPFISFYDLLMLNRHYNCTGYLNLLRTYMFILEEHCKTCLDRCDHSKTVCYLEGFPHPRDCSKCICPGGYGGVDCKQRPAGCGEEFTATSYPQVFHANVGRKSFGAKPREDYDKCHYWIKAPLKKRIEVKLLSFSPNGIAVDGCRSGGVEIKTQVDQRLTGYRFCSMADANITLVSDFYIVPIITYNRVYETGVSIQYRHL
ncbi:unnamed protein product [Heligmosomoides polygyrus]|uniref:Metalloendopeptidase n=1 Tax=Heligmosomoides polygyrus TaxID=6339 RepID=A0A183G107_HELPZ|nr:unnamed protein product [Heligmosomoides polygyrus]